VVTLIIGGSGSGKSAYAEDYICKKAGKNPKYYIATMKAADKETIDRIEKHRNMRKDKCFITIERPNNIGSLAKEDMTASSYALLECMSNLVANEMFLDGEPKSASFIVGKIVKEINVLSSKLNNLVIVSNNIFEDGIEYDEYSMKYIRALGLINQKLSEMAEEVIEVVVGLPVKIK
jgi:adenosylcobinamide kinase/adenosylcobinamide-phosphate guanylyltransferase